MLVIWQNDFTGTQGVAKDRPACPLKQHVLWTPNPQVLSWGPPGDIKEIPDINILKIKEEWWPNFTCVLVLVPVSPLAIWPLTPTARASLCTCWRRSTHLDFNISLRLQESPPDLLERLEVAELGKLQDKASCVKQYPILCPDQENWGQLNYIIPLLHIGWSVLSTHLVKVQRVNYKPN